MKKAIILHSFPFHYEMLGSVLHYFSEYTIDILSLEDHYWNRIYSKLYKNYKCIPAVIHTDYDLCILPTDDDKTMCDVYTKFFLGKPVYIINHIKNTHRSTIPDEYKRCIDIHGIQNPLQPFHFCGYKYVSSTHDKLRLVSQRVSVAIVGDIINRERFFFKELFNRFTNFKDIDFYVINRWPSRWKMDFPNVYYRINCNTEEMFNILEKCHYMYFFASSQTKTACSGCFGLAYSTLCRMLCSTDRKEQYEIESPLFENMESNITLAPVSKEDIEMVEKERDLLISKTNRFISEILK